MNVDSIRRHDIFLRVSKVFLGYNPMLAWMRLNISFDTRALTSSINIKIRFDTRALTIIISEHYDS